jgi:hypothetical protein
VADELHQVVTELLSEVAAARRTITYEELLAALDARDPDLRGRAEADLGPVLRAVSIATDESGRGLLTAVVVRSGSGLPGGGFFRLAAERGRSVSDERGAWDAELARVLRSFAAGG